MVENGKHGAGVNEERGFEATFSSLAETGEDPDELRTIFRRRAFITSGIGASAILVVEEEGRRGVRMHVPSAPEILGDLCHLERQHLSGFPATGR